MMKKEIKSAVAHYLSAGFRWRLIVKLINRRFATAYTAPQLKAEWEEAREQAAKEK